MCLCVSMCLCVYVSMCIYVPMCLCALGIIAAIVDSMHLPYLKHAVETVRCGNAPFSFSVSVH